MSNELFTAAESSPESVSGRTSTATSAPTLVETLFQDGQFRRSRSGSYTSSVIPANTEGRVVDEEFTGEKLLRRMFDDGKFRKQSELLMRKYRMDQESSQFSIPGDGSLPPFKELIYSVFDRDSMRMGNPALNGRPRKKKAEHAIISLGRTTAIEHEEKTKLPTGSKRLAASAPVTPRAQSPHEDFEVEKNDFDGAKCSVVESLFDMGVFRSRAGSNAARVRSGSQDIEPTSLPTVVVAGGDLDSRWVPIGAAKQPHTADVRGLIYSMFENGVYRHPVEGTIHGPGAKQLSSIALPQVEFVRAKNVPSKYAYSAPTSPRPSSPQELDGDFVYPVSEGMSIIESMFKEGVFRRHIGDAMHLEPDTGSTILQSIDENKPVTHEIDESKMLRKNPSFAKDKLLAPAREDVPLLESMFDSGFYRDHDGGAPRKSSHVNIGGSTRVLGRGPGSL